MAKKQASTAQRPLAPLVLLVVALVIVVAGLAFVLFNANRPHHPEDVSTVQHTAAAPATGAPKASASTDKTIRPGLTKRQQEFKNRTLPFDPPASASPCGPNMWSGNPQTSCAFVRVISDRAGVPDIHLDTINFTAHSPVTNKDYHVTCHRATTSGWKCTAGDNAVAYISP